MTGKKSHVAAAHPAVLAWPRRQRVCDSQPPNVALALSAPWQQSVFPARADHLASALSGTVKSAQAGSAKLEAAVGMAAHTLALH